MKYLFTLILCLVSIQQADAQSLSLFNIDASNFPIMKAKFYAIDSLGNQQYPIVSDLTLTEDGQPRLITKVNCQPATIKSLSVCMMIDTYGYGLIKLAHAGIQQFINHLHPPNDEIAMTIMNNGVQIHQDFTSDLIKATASVAVLSGAPNYIDIQKMFYYPFTGGVPFITGRTTDKKILILISDLHCPNLNLDTAKLYQDAAAHNISVYSVLLGTTDYSGLFKRVAAQTGGAVFERVISVPQVESVFQEIERKEHGIPCDITWESDYACQVRKNVEFIMHEQKAQSTYVPFKDALSSLSVSPSFIDFGKQIPATQFDTTLTITAQNADFTITGINRTFGSADFWVDNTSFPLAIPKNTSQTITLHFMPGDSSKQYASFEIESDKCLGYFSANGGFPGKKTSRPTINLTKPNGGEIFIVGNDTVITWNGVAPSDVVSLDYTIDNGTTWQEIASNATNLRHVWKNIPRPISNECKIRVKQIVGSEPPPGTLQFDFKEHAKGINAVQWSPDGSKIATASSDNTAIIWSATSGIKLFTLVGHIGDVWTVQWSPDGTKVVTASADNTAIIWSATSGAKLFTLRGHTRQVVDVKWSPDGTQIATASYDYTAILWSTYDGAKLYTLNHKSQVSGVQWSPDGTRLATMNFDYTGILWLAASGTELVTLTGHTSFIHAIQWSPDGTKVATASDDNTAILWSATTGANLFNLKYHTNSVTDVQWSPDGTEVLTSSYDRTAILWSVASGTKLYTLKGHSDQVIAAQWSPDGTKVATSSSDQSVIIWSLSSNTILFSLLGHTEYVNAIQWSPDGTKLVSAGFDNSAKIWSIANNSLQEDASDSAFSIVEPEPTLSIPSVDMGLVLVGQNKNNIVNGIICNKGSASLHVLGIEITSGDMTDFTIPRGAGDFFLDSNECKDVMFDFLPTKAGIRRAKATIRTTVGNFMDTISISGEGIPPALAIVNPFIDLGKSLVGIPKDSVNVITIKNIGITDLTIIKTDFDAFNTTNFTIRSGGATFTLAPNEEANMNLRFLPNDVGRRSGILQFHYNGVGSPATIQLFGEGFVNIPDTANTTVSIQDITAKAGEKVHLTLKLNKASGMQIVGAPTDWYARIHYNKSILFNEQTSNVCEGTTDSCVMELTGVYNPKTEELISIPCIATLGNTDHSAIVIDTFFWTNSAIVTEVATQNGTITLNGVCEDGGVRLFIPAKSSTSLTSRPNPAQDNLQIQYGLREPLTVTLELLTMTGQVAQTIINNQAQVAGQYTLTSDLSLLGNGVYLLRMRTNKEMLTTRVDVVK